MPEKLALAAVSSRVASELEAIGFSLARARPLKLIKKINAETEVFVYPGVTRYHAYVRIDPVIGLENVHLRERLLALDAKRWREKTRVCHAYLGVLESSGPIYLHADDQVDRVVAQIVKSVLETGLPRMQQFDTLDKVKDLLRDPWSPRLAQPRPAVLFEKEKLVVLQDQ